MKSARSYKWRLCENITHTWKKNTREEINRINWRKQHISNGNMYQTLYFEQNSQDIGNPKYNLILLILSSIIHYLISLFISLSCKMIKI